MVFLEAIDRTRTECRSLLDRRCAGRPELRAEVELLLHGLERSPTLFASETASPADALAAFVSFGPEGERQGDIVGRWTLQRKIGQGGFGSVWEAVQTEPVQRRVALKILQARLLSPVVRARFEFERQALALVDHPNVATLLDAGITSSDRPFFVMEFIEGEPITEYCTKAGASLRERLELFLQACAGIQAAHTKGIIHRDIKPSNVLVTASSGQPAVKVIDFGVAKVVGDSPVGGLASTLAGELIGTPEYMSPEQADGSLNVDTRIDIYALGVLLYELLTGLVPFERAVLLADGYSGMRRILHEQPPPRPRDRLQEAARAGEVERAEPGRSASLLLADQTLARDLRSDLEEIPLKAMRKDPSERYQSPTELADDVRRYLGGFPLRAVPESRVYRLRKLVKRRRGSVVAGSGLVLALALGLSGTLWQAAAARGEAARARLAADRERAAKDEARTHSRRAARINRLLTESLQSSDPTQGGSQDMLVSDAMLTVAANLDRGKLAREPEIESELRLNIAIILLGNGRLQEAGRQAQIGLTINQRLGQGDSEGVAAGWGVVGAVAFQDGRLADAADATEMSLAMYRRLYPGDHSEVATSLNNYATVCSFAGRSQDSLRLHKECLAMRRRLSPGGHQDVGASLVNVASSQNRIGQFRDAEANAAEAVALFEGLFPNDHPYRAQAMDCLATACSELGQAERAAELYEKTLAMRRRMFGGDHPEVASSLNNLAAEYDTAGRAEEALVLYQEALDMDRRLYSGDHPHIVDSLNNIGMAKLSKGSHAEAADLFSESLAMSRRLNPDDHFQTARVLNNLGRAYQLMDRIIEADASFAEAAGMYRRIFPGDHPDSARAIVNLATTREVLGFAGEAVRLLAEAADMRRRVLSPDDPKLASTVAALAQLHERMGNVALAEPLWREVVALKRDRSPQGGPEVAKAQLYLGRCLLSLGRFEESERALLAARDQGRSNAIASPPETSLADSDLQTRIQIALTDLYAKWSETDPDHARIAR
jgi:serine/threonine protein kinase/tetratricopeptide (TPR) repeat protein